MAWLILILSGCFEAVWALALGASDGFRKKGPTLLFLVTNVLSLVGLAWAMRTIPTGTAYAVWTGIGAALTVAVSILSGKEKADVIRVLLIVLLVSGVVGLKVIG